LSETLSKRSAHLILTLFDIAALSAAYVIYRYCLSIQALLKQQAHTIELESSLLYIILLLIVPVIHFSSVAQSMSSKKNSAINKLMAGLIGTAAIGLICSKYIIQNKLEDDLEKHGYVSCDSFSKGRYKNEIYHFSTCSK